MLLIHGARSVLCHAKKADTHDRLRSWALDLEKARQAQQAAVALANKLARIVWAVWKHDRAYEAPRPRRRSFGEPKQRRTRIEKTYPGTAQRNRVMAEQVGPAGGKPRTVAYGQDATKRSLRRELCHKPRRRLTSS